MIPTTTIPQPAVDTEPRPAVEAALDAALTLAGRGIAVFPAGTDKAPLTANGHLDATTDPDQVRALWAAAQGRAGTPRRNGTTYSHPVMVGASWGAAGMVIVDLDVKDGDDGPADLALLETHFGEAIDPNTPTLITPTGGRHLLMRQGATRVGSVNHPTVPGLPVRRPLGLDVKADGGYGIVFGPGYRWEDGLSLLDGIAPAPAPSWLATVAPTRKRGATSAVTDAETKAWLDEHQADVADPAVDAMVAELAQLDAGGRHALATRIIARAVARAAGAGGGDIVGAVTRTEQALAANRGRRGERRDTSAEVRDILRWLVRQQVAEQRRADDWLAQLEPGDDTATPAVSANLPDEFWQARPSLAHIRTAAHARARSADAVLGVVLARVSAFVGPWVRLPAPVGTPGTLDFIVAVIGRSGAGKSSSARVATELVPIDDDGVVEVSLGSGEGLIEAYFDWDEEQGPDGKTKRVKRQKRRAVLATLDEGQALAEMGGRKGATLLPTIRSAWTGDQLGQANASEERKRQIPAGSYRFAMVVGFQLEHAVALLDDEAGGTPQRFLFLSAEDPTVPDDAPEWPGPLSWGPKAFVKREMPTEGAICAEIRARALAVTRGELAVDPLDAHRDLSRLKTAGLLAIIDGRDGIDAEDWRLAGMVHDTSDRVRDGIAATAARHAAEAERAHRERLAERAAHLDEDASDRALGRMAKAIARHVHRRNCDGGCKRRCASRATKSKDRQLATPDDAIDLAIQRLWITRSGDDLNPGEECP